MGRRTQFAASFVLVLAGACKSGPKTVEECQAIEEGSPCSGTESCEIKKGCGVNGHVCRNGTWKRNITYCNPARPEKPPPEAK